MTNSDFRPDPAEFSDLAALYAMDVLEVEIQDKVEAYLAECPEFAQEIAEYADAVAAIPYGVSPVPMAADLKDRLFQRITYESPAEKTPDLLQHLITSVKELEQQAADLTWEPFPQVAGVMMATLQVDPDRREIAFFLRSETAVKFPRHRHATGEQILVLEGDFVVDGQVYGRGDRISSAMDTDHQPETLSGCLLLCVSSLDDEFLS